MNEVLNMFNQSLFREMVTAAYTALVRDHDVNGMERLVGFMDYSGFNHHSVSNQLTFWRKVARSDMAPRIIVDIHGNTFTPVPETATSTFNGSYFMAYYFDTEAVHQLAEAMEYHAAMD